MKVRVDAELSPILPLDGQTFTISQAEQCCKATGTPQSVSVMKQTEYKQTCEVTVSNTLGIG